MDDRTTAFGWMLRAQYPEKFEKKEQYPSIKPWHFNAQHILEELLKYNPDLSSITIPELDWYARLELERKRIHRNIDRWYSDELWKEYLLKFVHECQINVRPYVGEWIIGIDPYDAL